MSEPLHWVMASCALYRVPDGRGGLLDVEVSRFRNEWAWSAIPHGAPPVNHMTPIANGTGYPDPISARTAAEYWLSATREQNAIRAALEAEAQS